MEKFPIVSGKKLVKAFEGIGYRVVRKRGSHFRLHHLKRQPITIPDHKYIGPGLLHKILRDAECSVEELTEFF